VNSENKKRLNIKSRWSEILEAERAGGGLFFPAFRQGILNGFKSYIR
jgi:hypothetical protein